LAAGGFAGAPAVDALSQNDRLASLPMYDADRAAVEAWWHGVAEALRAEGMAAVPRPLLWPADLATHWREPRLLLSQACGYPLVTQLAGRVQVVGAFRYTAPGCSGIEYRSELVVRSADAGRRIEDFRGCTAALSDPHSHSGCNALRALVAPLAQNGRFFGRTLWSGSHRASMAMVQGGYADIAAIDCVTLAGLQRHSPGALAGLQTIGHTASAPGLPLITSLATPPGELAALQRALAAACANPALAPAREALLIGGFETVPAAAWQVIDEMRRSSASLADGTV
jgi:ABC-type phosphate/phosphonate transport system substrate-binding protein